MRKSDLFICRDRSRLFGRAFRKDPIISMKASMLESQFAALEAPKDAVVVDIELEPVQIVDFIVKRLGFSGGNPL